MSYVEMGLIVQDFLHDVPAYPYLWVPHCIMMSLGLRATLGDGQRALKFARDHPLSCYMLAILYTFPGGILSTLLLAEPPLDFLVNTSAVVVMTIAWYLVFYSPRDFFARMIDSMQLRSPLSTLQDFLRLHLCLSGVATIHQLHPGAFFYPMIFAVVKSSGFMFLKYAEYVLVKGVDRAFIIPHHSSKTCILASAAFAAQAVGYVSLGVKPILAGFTLLCVNLRIMSIFTNADPYEWFESALCSLVFGNNASSSLANKTAEQQQENNGMSTNNGGTQKKKNKKNN